MSTQDLLDHRALREETLRIEAETRQICRESDEIRSRIAEERAYAVRTRHEAIRAQAELLSGGVIHERSVRGEQARRAASGRRALLILLGCVVMLVWVSTFPGNYGRPSTVIPTRKDQEQDPHFDKLVYRERNVVERWIGWLKECRRVATRYEKPAVHYEGFVKLAMIQRLLRVI